MIVQKASPVWEAFFDVLWGELTVCVKSRWLHRNNQQGLFLESEPSCNVNKMNIKTVLLLLYCMIFPAIETNAKSISDSEFEDVLRNGFVVDVNADEVQVKKQLGAPIEIKNKLVDNPYSKVKDQITQYIYSGLEITFYECRNPQSLWTHIVMIDVSSERYKLKYGIRVGMRVDEINKLLSGRSRETWQSAGFDYTSYSMPLSGSEQINVAVKNDVVLHVYWMNWP